MFAIAVIISMVASFGLAGCKEEAPQEESVEEAAEEVAEEAAEEVAEEAAEEVVEEENWLGTGAIKYDLNAEVAGGEKVDLNIWWGTGPLNVWWEETAAQYMEIHPNVNVTFTALNKYTNNTAYIKV